MSDTLSETKSSVPSQDTHELTLTLKRTRQSINKSVSSVFFSFFQQFMPSPAQPASTATFDRDKVDQWIQVLEDESVTIHELNAISSQNVETGINLRVAAILMLGQSLRHHFLGPFFNQGIRSLVKILGTPHNTHENELQKAAVHAILKALGAPQKSSAMQAAALLIEPEIKGARLIDLLESESDKVRKISLYAIIQKLNGNKHLSEDSKKIAKLIQYIETLPTFSGKETLLELIKQNQKQGEKQLEYLESLFAE